MRISRKRMSIIIIVILFMAVFNDIIRLPGTVISGYRLALPIVLCMSLVEFRLTWRYFLFGSGMFFLLIIQNILFCDIFKYENSIDFYWQLRYLFYYAGIIAIFILIRILRVKYLFVFQRMFYKGIPMMGIACLFAYVGSLTLTFEKIVFTNQNDYGACLAAVFPWFFMESFLGKRRNIFWCVIIVAALLFGDSKAALAGILVQIGVITAIASIKKIKEGNKVLFFLVPVMVLGCLAIIFSPIQINGYSIKLMFTGMVSHIVNGTTYEMNDSSMAWRTNAIIYMLRGIKASHFMGIGIGNTGKLLRQLMPDIISRQKFASIAVSPHCAWLEFFCDCGIWAIGLCAYIYATAVKKLFRARQLDKTEIFFVAFTISFPVWIMGPSGIYTIYFIFIIIAWLYEWSKMRCQ